MRGGTADSCEVHCSSFIGGHSDKFNHYTVYSYKNRRKLDAAGFFDSKSPQKYLDCSGQGVEIDLTVGLANAIMAGIELSFLKTTLNLENACGI